MPNIFSGLGQGLGALGAGVSRGELAGTQYEFKARQAKALQDYRDLLLAAQGDKLKQQASLAEERINQQQRQMFGRKAQQIDRTLNDPTQAANLNQFPGLMDRLRREREDALSVATGQLDWRQVKPSELTDPVTGEVRLLPGATGPFQGPKPGPWAPGMAPGTGWQPQPGQPASENPYLDVRNRQGQQRVETGQQGVEQQGEYQRGQIRLGEGRLSIEGTRLNADLMERQFRDSLDLAKAQLTQGNTTFDQQRQIWGRVIGLAAETAKAGGDPGKDLKPFLFTHGAMGLQVPNEATIRDYLQRNGESEDTIRKVIQGNPLHGAGRSDLTHPGAQPTGAVMGSFQDMNGPPPLPPGSVQMADLLGGGPPTAAQVAVGGASPAGGLGVAPISGPMGGPGPARPNINAGAAGLGIRTPATNPPLRSPYPQGTVEDEVFGALTGRSGAPIPAKTILQNFQGTPYFRKVADVINRTNTQQGSNGLFAGMPVAGTNGAEWPNVPGFAAGQVQIPGAAVFAPPGTTPVVNQGGFGGAAPRTSAVPAPPAPPTPPGQPRPDMGPGGNVTLAPPPGPVLGPPQPMPGMPSPQIDLGAWNQGPLQGAGANQNPVTSPPQRPGETGIPLLDVPPPGSASPSSPGTGVMGVPATPNDPNLFRVPGAQAPSQVRNFNPNGPAIKRELQRYHALPYAKGIEKFLQANHIKDPVQQRDYYHWAEAEVVPRMIEQLRMSPAQVRMSIFGVMQRYGSPQAVSPAQAPGQVRNFNP